MGMGIGGGQVFPFKQYDGLAGRATVLLVARRKAGDATSDALLQALEESHDVTTAHSAREALTLLPTLHAGAVVAEVSALAMDARAFCNAIRASCSGANLHAILLVTEPSDADMAKGPCALGADELLREPVEPRELLARLALHLSVRSLTQSLATSKRQAMLGVMAASIAHQLRNPLTTLIAGLPAMQSRMHGRVDAQTSDLVSVMIDCAQSIDRMTRDLMDLARIDRAGRTELRVSDGLRSAVRLTRARVFGEVGIQDAIGDSPVLHGRPGDLNHVFMNLLDNALRAVGERGMVRVSGAQDGDRYVVCVEDSGPGVDEGVLARIFEPFFTTRRVGEGTGLGLSIALQVVQEHGGAIEVGRSALGGARFKVTLPTDRDAPLH